MNEFKSDKQIKGVVKYSDDKIKVFGFSLMSNDDYLEFKEKSEGAKEVLEHFEKLHISGGTLRVFYFDLKEEGIYAIYKIELEYNSLPSKSNTIIIS